MNPKIKSFIISILLGLIFQFAALAATEEWSKKEPQGFPADAAHWEKAQAKAESNLQKQNLKLPFTVIHPDGVAQHFDDNGLLIWQDGMVWPGMGLVTGPRAPRIEFFYENGNLVRAELTPPHGLDGYPRLEKVVFDFKTMQATAEIPTGALTKSSIQMKNGLVELSFDSAAGERYIIQKRQDLSSPWVNTGEIIGGDGKRAVYQETASGESAFYRVLRILPARVIFALSSNPSAPKGFQGFFNTPVVRNRSFFDGLGIIPIGAEYTDASGGLHHQTLKDGRVVKDAGRWTTLEFGYDESGRLKTITRYDSDNWAFSVGHSFEFNLPESSAVESSPYGGIMSMTEYESLSEVSGTAANTPLTNATGLELFHAPDFDAHGPENPNLVALASWYNPFTFQHKLFTGVPKKTVWLTLQSDGMLGRAFETYFYDRWGQIVSGIFHQATYTAPDGSKIRGEFEWDFAGRTGTFKSQGRTIVFKDLGIAGAENPNPPISLFDPVNSDFTTSISGTLVSDSIGQ